MAVQRAMPTTLILAMLLAPTVAHEPGVQSKLQPAKRNIAQRVGKLVCSLRRSCSQPLPLPAPPPPPGWLPWLASVSLLGFALFLATAYVVSNPIDDPGMVTTILRLLLFRGLRWRGNLTGMKFPVRISDVTPEALTAMLRLGGHLPCGVEVRVVEEENVEIRDGVKGVKGVIRVQYSSSPASLPTRFFVKCNIERLNPMRLLIETSECAKCEALFYHHLANNSDVCPTHAPVCYFVDYSDVTGSFCLVTEVVEFGSGGVRALKHRIRDAAQLEEQRAFVEAGAELNARLWADQYPLLRLVLPRFDRTHRRMWTLAQLTARIGGLHHTMRKTLKGRPCPNAEFMTWDVPAGLIGREAELIADMPRILSSLCEDEALLAYGHNDWMTDNVAFADGRVGAAPWRVFDWQQACYNSVGQEWAWNFHFLEPSFLEAHEEELLSTLLNTYRKHGRTVSREAFLRAYVLGTVQMFVWGGGGLQLLMADLQRKGLLASLCPNDERNRGGSGSAALDGDTREKLLGAEMTRRTFTNVCGIMRRHDFVGAWQRWRAERGLE